MFTLMSVLIVAACVLLTLVVLVQNSKGGGLAANFSSNNQVMGAPKTADFLEKATWTLAIALVLFCIVASYAIPRGTVAGGSIIDQQIENTADPSVVPSFPLPSSESVLEEQPADSAN